MTNNVIVLILDLDGVLITTPSWKADEIDFDGYSKFNSDCVVNLNRLLSVYEFEIWLSSSRRKSKTLSEFNAIFENRNINQKISGLLPEYSDLKSRRLELLRFIKEFQVRNFLIIDDDKSLNDLKQPFKENLILTELHSGFNIRKLEFTLNKLKNSF